MKVTKKLLLLGLAMIVLLTMSVPVFALPGNTVVVGNKAFSMDYFFDEELDDEIVAAITSGDDIYLDPLQAGDNFIDAFTGEAITDAQKESINNIEYKNYDGTKDVYAKFDDKTPVDNEIKVVSIVALNATTIKVTFSDEAVKEFTGQALKAGENKVTFEYKGKTFADVSVTYTPAAAEGTKVEKIEFVNYRYIKVTFDGLVDKASAQDASNYYFEIVDGNAEYGALPTLRKSNQLSEIQTQYAGGSAAKWWNGSAGEGLPRHIVAEDIGGKTIVNIYLPEDARFTNVEDKISGNYPYPYSAADCERTLGVEMRNSKTDGYTIKKLIKDTTVNVAVRNIKDTDGKLSINTASMPIRILDTVNPKLVGITVGTKPVSPRQEYSSNLGSYLLKRTNPMLNQAGEALKFEYDEPVFDAHCSDMSDLDWYRDIALYVNGKPVASLSAGNLKDYMKFDMGNSSYYSAKVVTIDVEKAVKDVYKEQFATGIDYIIHYVGVTDLAGNIEVNSDHTFTVRFYDGQVPVPEIVMPKVLDVVQVADNVFRVEFNRAGVQGKFVIENPDGEGQGIFYKTPIVPSAASGGKFYSYVAVPACDNEDAAAIAVPTGIEKNQILAYDGNESIVRKIRVEKVVVLAENDPVSDNDLLGEDFLKTMVLKDDVSSPVIGNGYSIAYDDRGSSIAVSVTDVVPYEKDANLTYMVSPIAYVYNPITESFTNEIVPNQENADTYLPIRVSYVDEAGKTHPAMVSNRDLDPDNTPDSGDENFGAPGNIAWIDGKLILNLSNYEQLLDSEGKLVPGAVYKVEIPAGYFTDSPLDLNFNDHFDFDFGGEYYDILHVDDARDGNNYRWRCFTDAGLGYTSVAKTINVSIGTPAAPPPPAEYVPQTSKELINYDEATNSMKIEFKGTIDPATLTDKNNYSFNGKTLAQWDAELGTDTEIEFSVIGGQQYAIFKIPQDSIQQYGNYEFTVKGVAHPDGGTMVPVTTIVRLQDVSRPVVINAEQAGLKQIKLTFNEPIMYFVDSEVTDAHAVAKNFKVYVNGVSLTVDTAVLPIGPDSDREITLNLGSEIPSTGTITVQIVKDGNGNILVIDKANNKNPIKEATYEVTRLSAL